MQDLNDAAISSERGAENAFCLATFVATTQPETLPAAKIAARYRAAFHLLNPLMASHQRAIRSWRWQHHFPDHWSGPRTTRRWSPALRLPRTQTRRGTSASCFDRVLRTLRPATSSARAASSERAWLRAPPPVEPAGPCQTAGSTERHALSCSFL